jgi:hypothetical protein
MIKLVVKNKSDKQALAEWDELLLSVQNSTPVDVNETEEQKRARIRHLEKPGNEEAWVEYYFPKFAFSKAAPFQIKSFLKVVRATRLYQRRAWARGLSKSTRRMFEVFYLVFVKKLKVNQLLISKSEGNAIRLLAPYRANLECNQRLINDYGKQMRPGKWTEEEFITRSGSSFRAVGAEQNPRGARLDEMRPNVIIFDDVDDDEVCRNPDRLENRWQWIERAVIPTVDIAKPYYIFFDNNIIAEDSIAVRAAAFADDVELVNVRDANGISTWPEKNSEADIAAILSKLSYEAGQSEYFNNPMSQGKAFPSITYGKCPPPSKLQFLQVYADPATSNKDKPTQKSKASTSSKAVWVIGWDGTRLYVYYGFLGAVNNTTFIDWLYSAYQWALSQKAPVVYVHVENNTLQDPFYQQVFVPLIIERQKRFGLALPVVPDGRDKPDKWFRIEGNLEPLNRNGHLIFNAAESDNPHMKALEAQFKSAKATSRTLDGPDCIEGGYFLAKERLTVGAAASGTWGGRTSHSKRY